MVWLINALAYRQHTGPKLTLTLTLSLTLTLLALLTLTILHCVSHRCVPPMCHCINCLHRLHTANSVYSVSLYRGQCWLLMVLSSWQRFFWDECRIVLNDYRLTEQASWPGLWSACRLLSSKLAIARFVVICISSDLRIRTKSDAGKSGADQKGKVDPWMVIHTRQQMRLSVAHRPNWINIHIKSHHCPPISSRLSLVRPGREVGYACAN